jgi:hypothetical protein
MKTAKNNRRPGNIWASLAIAASLLAFGQCQVRAGTPAVDADAKKLSILEYRLFFRDYASDSDQERLVRLEKFVYGGAQTGSLQDRLSSLNNVAQQFKVKKTQDIAPALTKAPVAEKSDPLGPASANPVAPSFAYANYPRVTELEKHMLGTNYPNESLPERLSRLETKAFGKPSGSTDLAQRVDSLDQYADRHDIYHERQAPVDEMAPTSPLSIASRPADPPQNPFLGNTPDNSTDRISVMERMVFGHVYENRPDMERMERLEKKLVPYEHNLAQKDLPYRVNNVWNILKVANTMNSTPISRQTDNLIASAPPRTVPGQDVADTSSAQPSSHKSWLHGLGKYMSGSGDNSPGLTQLGFPGTMMQGAHALPGTPAQQGATWGF